MARYRLEASYTRWYTLEVEADSCAEAEARCHEDDEIHDDGSGVGWELVGLEEKLQSITLTE